MTWTEAIEFYERNYELIGKFFLKPGKRTFLGRKDSKTCRFCSQKEPQVTFKLEAHALPEALGNKSLFSNYECDSCNQLFGGGIENDFGNWSKPMRTFARISGKNGVPTIKKGSSGGWRVEYAQGFKVSSYIDEPIARFDEDANTLTLEVKRDPYTPVAVMKCFVKMALTLMPEDEVGKFGEALGWIRDPDHTQGLLHSVAATLHTFQPGALPNDLICALLLRRRASSIGMPYCFFVLSFGNDTFQIALPAKAQDAHLEGSHVALPPHPVPGDLIGDVPAPVRRPFLLNGVQRIKGEPFVLTFKYDTRVLLEQGELTEADNPSG